MDVYTARLPRVLSHLRLLLSDRGYEGFHDVTDPVAHAIERGTSIGESLTCIVTRGSRVLHVVFLDPIFDATKGGRETQTSTFQLAAAASYATRCDVLAISFPKLSPDASKSALRMRRRSPGLNPLEVLTFANLAFPISTHVLVPKHTALSVDEAKAFETSRKIARDKLPLLKLSDPVRIWYGWTPNTIVRIDRSIGVAWRVVK